MTLRWLTAGESHGPSLVAILEGLPAHVSVTSDDIRDALARRRLGYGRGARMKFEQDEVTHRRWGAAREHPGRPGGDPGGQHRVAQVGDGHVRRPGRPRGPRGVGAQRPADPPAARATRTSPACRSTPSTRRDRCWSARRPGRRPPGSPWAGSRRTSSSRPSARGSSRHVIELGGVRAPDGLWPEPGRRRRALDDDPVRCLDPDSQRQMVAEDRPGPRGRRHPRRRRRGGRPRAAAGPGLARALGPAARLAPGRRAHGHPGDQGRRGRRRLRPGRARPARSPTTRWWRPPTASGGVSGRSGGTEGGMTTGEVLRVRAAMKPIATVPRALRTVDVATGEEAVAHHQRSDVCAVPAAGDRRRGDGGPRARRRRAGEVRRRLARRDRGATSRATWTP